MAAETTDYARWLGRTEARSDHIAASPLDRLAATFDRDDPPFAAGDPVPPLGHWLYFLPNERQSALDPDGHAKRGGFLPPVHDLPRRMWAGSRLTFSGDLRVGADVVRHSEIVSVREKSGAGGPLVFVTVRHTIGEPGTPPLIIDEHDIVFRGLAAAAVKATSPMPTGAWHRAVTPDDVMLFRYSALTFNGHRIHYDRVYATRDEGYPGLVVHGPLVATLLVDLVRRRLPGARIAAVSFRAVSPLFDGQPVNLNGSPPAAGQHDMGGVVKLWATNAAGGLAMQGEARMESGGTGQADP